MLVTSSRPQPERLVNTVARWVLFAAALILLVTAGWIRYRFGKVNLEQVILHLPVGGDADQGNADLIREGLWLCLVTPLVSVGLIAALSVRRISPGRRRGGSGWRRLVPITGFALSLGILLTVVGVPQYTAALIANRSVGPYYVEPTVLSAPSAPLNLITIYMESMETTYGDEALFGDDLLADLDQATSGWSRLGALQQYPGGGWTMAGIVGTQCGIPLKSRLLAGGVNPNDFGEQVDSFLGGATCLGDVLEEAGYTSVFLGGANPRFAGKDTFLTGHGYNTVLGLPQWEAGGASPSDISVWGLSDKRLFENATEVVDELAAGDAPFNLGILTLDTHEPASVYDSCRTNDADPMATAIRCSSRAVASFLDHLGDAGLLENSVVVVMGDHLKVTSDGGSYQSELEGTEERTIVYAVSSPRDVQFSRDSADQLSVFASTLELLGFTIADGRAGVGVSFASDHPVMGTALELPSDEYAAVITAPSTDFYRRLWGQSGG